MPVCNPHSRLYISSSPCLLQLTHAFCFLLALEREHFWLQFIIFAAFLLADTKKICTHRCNVSKKTSICHQMLNPSKRVTASVKCLSYKINYARASLLACCTHTKRRWKSCKCFISQLNCPALKGKERNFNFFSKNLDGERDMCALWLDREVTPGVWLKGGGGRERATGQKKGKRKGGRGVLLEGSTDRATLERLRRTVVVHHAALGLALSGEEQTAEFGHLWKGRRQSC